MRTMLRVVSRDHKYISVPIKLVAVSLYFTAVAQLPILKTMQHVSHLLWQNFLSPSVYSSFIISHF